MHAVIEASLIILRSIVFVTVATLYVAGVNWFIFIELPKLLGF